MTKITGVEMMTRSDGVCLLLKVHNGVIRRGKSVLDMYVHSTLDLRPINRKGSPRFFTFLHPSVYSSLDLPGIHLESFTRIFIRIAFSLN